MKKDLRGSGFRVQGSGSMLKLKAYSLQLTAFCSALFFVFSLLLSQTANALEVVLLYTGETHAMLYTCSCPKEPDGGVARRAELVKKVRQAYPDALLLDSGSFFAGGLLDEFTQNTGFDTERTLVNLKAMERMKYAALNIGDNEFNFGKDFLLSSAKDTGLTFLSSNIEPEKAGIILPYVVKEAAGIKIGIIGVTNLAAHNKSEDLKFTDPKTSVAKSVKELKEKGVSVIVLLSQLEEKEDMDLLNDVKGIDILVGSHHPSSKDRSYVKLEETLILKPVWQGRSLGKAILTIEGEKLAKFKVEEIRLSDQVADDPEILTFLPRCFSDINCKREGLTGSCQESGTPKASCLFSAPIRVGLTVITSPTCLTCNTDVAVDFLKKNFPGIKPVYFNYPEKKAQDLIRDFGISGLPAYLLSKEVRNEKNFDALKANLEPKGDFYLVRPHFIGVSYFFNRKKVKGRFDLFISLFDKNTQQLLDEVKDLFPQVHFLAAEENGRFNAAKGEPEIQEYLRAVCVKKYYPENLWEYITCRSKDINSSWWDDCLAPEVDTGKVKSCAKAEEGRALLREDIRINKELQVLFGPTYLVDNQEIFSSNGVPRKEELKALIKK